MFTPHFLRIMVEVKTPGLPHVLKLWLGAGKGMLQQIIFLCQFKLVKIGIFHNIEVHLVTLGSGDITRLKNVVSVCYVLLH